MSSTVRSDDPVCRPSASPLVELYNFRELLFLITWRDIRVRYRQTVMGLLWAVLMPAVITAAGVVFHLALTAGGAAHSQILAALTVKALPWAFFVGAIRFATASLLANSNLISKSNFPRELLPLSAVFSQFADFMIAVAIAAVVLVGLEISPGLHLLWIPILIALLVGFACGLGLILSAANLFYRDVKYLVEVGLTFGIFFTPVLFDSSAFGKWQPLMLLNPLAAIIEGFSDVTVRHSSPNLGWLTYSGAIVAIMLLLGYRWFKRIEAQFVERL